MQKHLLSFLLCIPLLLSAQKRFYTIDLASNDKYDSPIEKQGWNLIFEDNFEGDTLNKNFWDISTINDDFPCWTDISKAQYFANFPQNVTVNDGKLILYNRTNIPPDTSCASLYGSGEVKTFDNFSWKGTPFRNYGFPPDCYVETRVKMANPDTRTGSCFWLCSVVDTYSEIDFFETYNRKDRFKTSIYYGKNVTKIDDRRFKVRDAAKKRKNLSDSWLVFACAYNHTNVKTYLNDKLYFEANMDSLKGPTNAMAIRIGSGNTLDKDEPRDLPTSFEIDYVRVYKKTGTKAIEWWSKIQSMEIGTTLTLSCRYFPGISYNWISDYFDFMPAPSWQTPNIKEIKPRMNIVRKGESYPVKVVVTFPRGYQEVLETMITIKD